MTYYLLFFVSTFISAVSQILLKISANCNYENVIREYLNGKVIFAYGLFFLSSILTFYAYRYVPLSKGVVLETSGYVFVFALGFLCLKESLTKKKIFGVLLIIAGIIIANV